MKNNTALFVLGAALVFGATTANAKVDAAAATTDIVAATNATASAAKKATNTVLSGFFNISSWKDGAGDVKIGKTVDFNPVKPADWVKIIDPKTHSLIHMSATNPEHYAQYLSPEYALQFMNPELWASYMDVNVYTKLTTVLMDAETAKYWSQPGAFMHSLNPEAYAQLLNPNVYIKLSGTVVSNMVSDKGWGKYSAFNPFNMMKKLASSFGVKPAAGATAAQ